MAALAVAAALGFSGVLAAPASAASTNPAVRTAILHSSAGYLTAADRAALKTDPETAKHVIDPAKTTSGATAGPVRAATPAETASMALIAPNAVAAGYFCRTADAWRIYRGTFGVGTIYHFHQKVTWCYQQGGTVHEVPSRYWYLSDTDFTAKWVGIVGDHLTGLNTSTVNAYYQGHFEHCLLKYGCIGNSYPYVDMNLKSDGTYPYTTGN